MDECRKQFEEWLRDHFGSTDAPELVLRAWQAAWNRRASQEQAASEPVGKLIDEGFRQIEWYNKPEQGALLFTRPQPAQPCAQCVNHVEEIKHLQRKVSDLNEIKFQKFNNEECWIYQGNGEDHLESLTCPVVIPADKLAALEAENARLNDELDSLKTVADREFEIQKATIAQQAEEMLRLIETIKYLRGIAERGTGAPCPEDVTVEQFVLGYVKQLEQQAERIKELEGAVKQNDETARHYLAGRTEALQQLAAAQKDAEQQNSDFNSAIDHTISLGLEASEFLRFWREGDWDTCKEFGFEVSDSLRNPAIAAHQQYHCGQGARQEEK